ncbi:MAG TPA: nuclear transport factor 2 family protein [Actinomycetales bacterium]|nr:nuclear transport factor 2 family protein [Actinomycetales bacterium]
MTNSQSGTARTTREVLESHLAMRKAGDLEGDLAQNYAEDVVLLSWGEGVNHGASGVRKLASILRTYVDSGEYEYHQVLSDGNYGMLRWSAAGSNTNIRDGTDSFAVENGRIVAQTIAYTTYSAKSSNSAGAESS